MKIETRFAAIAVASLLACVLLIGRASAQNYPTKTVRIIVPHTAAAPFDGEVRAFAQSLMQVFGQPFVIENRDGADGLIGAEACAKAAPDGHTLCATTSSVISLNPAVRLTLPYDPVRDFAPIIHAGVINSAVIVHPSVPANSFRELLALARAKPDSITWATMGTTSIGTLFIGWLRSRQGISFYMVPYKNATQGLNGTVAGDVQVTAYAVGQVVPLAKAGKVRALAITGNRRSALLPGVPATKEDGIDLSSLRTWVGLFAPAGTPRAIVQRLNGEMAKLLHDPGFRDKFLLSRGLEPDEVTGASSEVFSDFVKSDRESFVEIVAAIGLKKE